MIVEELIDQLKKCNPKSRVLIPKDTKMAFMIVEVIEKNDDETGEENYVALLSYGALI